MIPCLWIEFLVRRVFSVGNLPDELVHPLDNSFGIVFGLDDRFTVFLTDFDFGTGGYTESFTHVLWEHDSPFRIHLYHSPT